MSNLPKPHERVLAPPRHQPTVSSSWVATRLDEAIAGHQPFDVDISIISYPDIDISATLSSISISRELKNRDIPLDEHKFVMKIGGQPEPRNEVPLPVEVIEKIVTYAENAFGRVEDAARLRQLWAFCLVSKLWYSAAIKALYKSPRLTTRNFDTFSRTICPPLNAPARSVGLENLIENLDMTIVAYSSTKSITARLLRRTRQSLLRFTSPSHSFSIASLAPISKCMNLQVLDLSADSYDFDLAALLRATRGLSRLTVMSTPRGAFSSPYPAPSPGWPTALRTLEIRHSLPVTSRDWLKFVSDIPSSLRFLLMEHFHSAAPFALLCGLSASAPNVTKLTIQDVASPYEGDPEPIHLESIMGVFPGLTTLTLPIISLSAGSLVPVPPACIAWNLKQISFSDLNLFHGDVGYVAPEDVDIIISSVKSIQRVELPRYYTCGSGDVDDISMLLELDHFLKTERWPAKPPEKVGIHFRAFSSREG